MEYEEYDDFVHALPKADLHLHLDGSVKPATLLELAAEQGHALPATDPNGLLPYMQVGESNGSLTEYLRKFDFVLPYLQNGEALERVACETVQQAAASGALYLEVRFGPMLHTRQGLSPDEALRRVIDGLREGERRYGIPARAIAICMRHNDEQRNLTVVEAAAQVLGSGLVAIDLAGDESRYPTAGFRRVFEHAALHGLPATIHAGEAAGPDSIREAIEGLGAVRIGHGVRAREDAAVLELLKERRIPLEMCPSSNLQTKAVDSWASYPLRRYYDEGLVVTVNTDNPTVSGTTIASELRLLQELFGFTRKELAAVALAGIDAAFLEPDAKRGLRHEAERRLAALGIDAAAL
jgi:adenosine deaminase